MSDYSAFWKRITRDDIYRDFDRLLNNLYVGSRPPCGNRELANLGFNTVVLCAEEYQPVRIPGISNIIHCPLIDFDLNIRRINWAERTAQRVAELIKSNKDVKVLVCCVGGHDRSPFVAALILHYLTGMPADVAAEYVRCKRRGALRDIQGDWLTVAYDKDYSIKERRFLVDAIVDHANRRWYAKWSDLTKDKK